MFKFSTFVKYALSLKKAFISHISIISMNDNTKQKHIVHALLTWFSQNARELPWRGQKDPYKIWISEIMLQQTQVERVKQYFLRFMQYFPDINALAEAKEEDVLRAWEGLGYYSRAKNIHKAAKIIQEKYNGIFPDEVAEIRALPGIGPYTTAAIASIAFDFGLPSIDANVERLMARLYDIDSPVKQEPAASRIRTLTYKLAQNSGVLAQNQMGTFNEAMMELGALICSKKPLCENCPVQKLCESYRLNITHERPVPGKRAPIGSLQVVTGVLHHNGKVFVQKRLPRGVWGSLWEFPGGCIEKDEKPEAAIVREFKEETNFDVHVVDKYTVIKHGYTTYRITLHCYALSFDDLSVLPEPSLTAATAYQWLELAELENFAMPAAHRKLADMLL